MLLLWSANLHPFMICFLFSHFWDASPSPKLFHKVLISRSLPLHILAIGSTVAVHACVAPILQQFRSSFILWMKTYPCSKYEPVHFVSFLSFGILCQKRINFKPHILGRNGVGYRSFDPEWDKTQNMRFEAKFFVCLCVNGSDNYGQSILPAFMIPFVVPSLSLCQICPIL